MIMKKRGAYLTLIINESSLYHKSITSGGRGSENELLLLPFLPIPISPTCPALSVALYLYVFCAIFQIFFFTVIALLLRIK